MLLLSIIVPIYNVEKYLVECIQSVLEQEYKDYELILVDDGSPDNCGHICDSFAQKDSRIKVIHKQNGGLSDARNNGLNIARGEYILFLDSDDYMKSDSLDDAMRLLNNKDMLICPIIKTYPDGELVVNELPIRGITESLDRDSLYNRMASSRTFLWKSGNNIYRRRIIEENAIMFEVDLIGAEDCDFFMRFVRVSNNYILYNKAIIHYRLDREGSITNIMSYSAILGELKVFQANHYIYQDKESYHEELKRYFANKYANSISLLNRISVGEELEHIIQYLDGNSSVLRDTQGMKYIIARWLWRIFGYYRGTRILRFIHP